MTQELFLVTQAAKAAGTAAEVARRLGVSPQTLAHWKSGTVPCPPEEQANLAAIAGLDPIRYLCLAHLQRHQGTAKGERLRKVLASHSRSVAA